MLEYLLDCENEEALIEIHDPVKGTTAELASDLKGIYFIGPELVDVERSIMVKVSDKNQFPFLLDSLLNYLWEDEKSHYEGFKDGRHIFMIMKKLEKANRKNLRHSKACLENGIDYKNM